MEGKSEEEIEEANENFLMFWRFYGELPKDLREKEDLYRITRCILSNKIYSFVFI